MTPSPTATVPTLTLRRTFSAPRARVFAAWTRPEQIRQWFCPPGFSMPEADLDLRVGGRYRIAMRNADGEDYIAGGVFTEVRAPERLAYTWRWVEDDPADERDTSITIDFIDRGAETEMVFRHEGFVDDASRGRHETGWNEMLENLTALLARPFTVTGMDLSGYMVKDGARAIAFYRDVLGFVPTTVYPDNRGAEFELADGTTFALWGGGDASPFPFQPSNGILFAVDDLAAAVAAVKARGIAVLLEHETPSCTMAMINDTEGNSVVLHKLKAT